MDGFAIEATKPLKEHLDAYAASLNAKRRSENHIDSTRSIIEKMGFGSLSAINADSVHRYAAQMNASGKAARTIAAHLQAIKGFTRWATLGGKVASDPLVTVTKPSIEDDRRLVRRYLSHDEWRWLDSTTRSSQEGYGMSGIERALLYAVAIQTGLRSNELRTLTRGKLHLKTNPPFIMADAARTKNGKPARQYIQPELALELSQHIRSKLAGAVVFSMPSKFDVADMLRVDLVKSRCGWLKTIDDTQERIEAEQGDFLRAVDSELERIDFHSLRHTTASWLIQAGADIKAVQSIMRHSDIKLTLDRYGHLFKGAEADAVAGVRSAFIPIPQQATGTNGEGSARSSNQSANRYETVRLNTTGVAKLLPLLNPVEPPKPLGNRRFTNKNTGRKLNRPSRARINSDSPSNSNEKNSVPLPVPSSGTIRELLAIWEKLDYSARRDLLAVARGWVKAER